MSGHQNVSDSDADDDRSVISLLTRSDAGHGAVAPRGVHYKQKYVPSIGERGDCVPHSFNLRMAGLCLADALVYNFISKIAGKLLQFTL